MTLSPASRPRENANYNIEDTILARGSAVVFESLLADDALEEIMFNGPHQPLMVCHRQFGMCRVNAVLDEEFVWPFIQQIVVENGAKLDESNPIFDGALADGSRINVVAPPVAHQGLSFTIRKFLKQQLQLRDIVRSGTISAEAAAFLWCCIDGLGGRAANILVVGGTGSGKTTTLAALLMLVDENKRLVLIEDTPEIPLSHPNAVRLVTKAGTEMQELMRSALRMRPDRIVVGEVRGAEAVTLFEAMNTGHDGCAGTLHANSARESIHRISHAPMSVPLGQMIGLDLIIVQERRHGAGANRVVTEISEVGGYGENVLRLNKLFEWDEKKSALVATGVPSRFRSTLCKSINLSASAFAREQKKRQSELS